MAFRAPPLDQCFPRLVTKPRSWAPPKGGDLAGPSGGLIPGGCDQECCHRRGRTVVLFEVRHPGLWEEEEERGRSRRRLGVDP